MSTPQEFLNKPYQFKSDAWSLHQVVTPKKIGILLVIFLLLGWSAHNTHMDKAFWENTKALGAMVGIGESGVLDGAKKFAAKAFPIAIESKIEVDRLDNFNPDKLPMFSRIEVKKETDYDTLTNTYKETETKYLVHSYGYLGRVLYKMWETIEMAFWGTFLSVLISVPLGVLSARNYSPNRAIYGAARGVLGFHRAMPELILALFFVLMYGFGPIAGIFALAVHTSGVLGKFFADEIENAPPGPQDALKATGAGKLKVLRYAVMPQVFPQYVAYVQYIFERNIRTATVLGIVGAGGIGMELKGRWDLFDYGHVATILIVIFATVMLLEYLSQKLRAKAL
jgi:phosphonate transport system permease protein